MARTEEYSERDNKIIQDNWDCTKNKLDPCNAPCPSYLMDEWVNIPDGLRPGL